MEAPGQMHYIQRDIISRLTQKSPLRFSELQPPGLANNTFSYHLKTLVQRGYVESTPSGYKPTRKTFKTFPYMSDHAVSSQQGPIVLMVVHVTNSRGDVLMLKRKRKPFNGKYGIPSGLLHKGEDLLDAAKRQLFEKVGIEAKNELEPAGILNFRYLQKDSGDIFVHALGLVYTYHLAGNGAEYDNLKNRYGTLRWSDFDHDDILPEAHSFHAIAKSPFYTVLSSVFEEPECCDDEKTTPESDA